MDKYIECYNTKRIKAKLKGLTLVEYRNQALQAASLKVFNFMKSLQGHHLLFIKSVNVQII
ncbi:IS3 family transposase [Providencia sp. Je.9.19]|uniref:IS3 family transposase n=1 Tax=Providencia sp. Je.9.19 TaxID=3142844 RepID=UPI003DA82984